METKNTFQSYLQAEIEELVIDGNALGEWERLVEELGLHGQKSVSRGTKSPIPFLFMTPAMVATFETLCPREVDYQAYRAGAIPMPALDLIALAVREKHFDRIMIRYDDKSPDPVAIGERITGAYPHVDFDDFKAFHTVTDPVKIAAIRSSGMAHGVSIGERFLIARWGAENKPIEELAKMAKARHMRERGAELNKTIKDAQHGLNVLEEEATEKYGC